MNLHYVIRFIKPLFDITPLVYNVRLIILGISAFHYDLFSFIPAVVSKSLNLLPGSIELDNNVFGLDLNTSFQSHKETVYSIVFNNKSLDVHRYIDTAIIDRDTLLLENNIQEIMNKNLQLKKEMDKRAILIKKKERFRLAGEVHNILGYSLSSIICLVESCRFNSLQGVEYTDKIDRAINISDSGIHDLESNLNDESLTLWKKRFYEFISEIEVYDLGLETIIIDDRRIPDSFYRVLYKILKEALTNCRKYSHATNITVGLQVISEEIYFHIIYNGIGCSIINKGTGLNNIVRRITDLSGKINFYSEPLMGFQTSIIFPGLPRL